MTADLSGYIGAGLSPAHRPYVLTAEDFQVISKMLYEDAGIYLTEAKTMLVYSRLAKRLRALGLESFRDYCALVSSEQGVDERQRMLAALTTNVTRFFREAHHFEHLKKTVLLPRVASIRQGSRLRIWSAACSDGQEPLSIAMTILAVLPDAAKLDLRVLATDIDPNMIATAVTGIYGRDAAEALPEDYRIRWFTSVGRGLEASRELRSLVVYRELNLLKPWPFRGRFDAAFCRNVAIYFDSATQENLWTKFLTALQPEGRLYIGHSERIGGAAARNYEIDGMTTYRLRRSSEQ